MHKRNLVRERGDSKSSRLVGYWNEEWDIGEYTTARYPTKESGRIIVIRSPDAFLWG